MAQMKDAMISYLSEGEIDDLVTQMAREIEIDYSGKELVLVCPLKGSVLFMSDLCRKLDIPVLIDFVQLVRSTPQDKPGEDVTVKILKDISVNIAGKHVLILEEIIDEGRTLNFLKNRILASAPASLKIATLLDKPSRRVINIKPDYIGKTVEDRFVVGYGMDDGEVGRNYKEIYYLKH